MSVNGITLHSIKETGSIIHRTHTPPHPFLVMVVCLHSFANSVTVERQNIKLELQYQNH